MTTDGWKIKMPKHVVLPTADDLGMHDDWKIRSGVEVVEFTGRLLAVTSTRRSEHDSDAHSGGDGFAPRGTRCTGCRWHEIRIFSEERPDDEHWVRYLVHRTGNSIVPGDRILTSHTWCTSAHEVIQSLITVRDGAVRISHAVGRAFGQAAGLDSEFRDSWIISEFSTTWANAAKP